MKLETLRAFADALDISVGLLFYQENKNELILTLAKMLDGQSSEFIESIMALVRVCMENFEKKTTDSDDLCYNLNTKYWKEGDEQCCRSKAHS